ncbi:pyridoxamine 5'-phosphate oxidase family protein [Dyadobacter tibetensis]|uniref:pyridoxamine 5'-phosphate oxidase family protein n=1 Tax=Dyadobacter tibetensis TaxID=1211851 RepID=UPI000470442D|nr:pyridoxamine 5'-phosphate oxidase family protein [Dyadobacter tibetensis]
MGKIIPEITQNLHQFIEAQKIFFVATASNTGSVNLSPKGMDTFRIISPSRVLWLNLTGSGNETAAHLLENDRMTIMFCAFEGKPLILRLYGRAKTFHPRNEEWSRYIGLFPAIAGARQIFDMKIDTVQTSCGMAVPFMDFVSERKELENWADKQGPEGVQEYWSRKNRKSLDGRDTGIFE